MRGCCAACCEQPRSFRPRLQVSDKLVRFEDERADSVCVPCLRGVHPIISNKGIHYMVKVTYACECAAHRAVQHIFKKSVVKHIECRSAWPDICVLVMRDAGPDLMQMAMSKPIPPLQAMKQLKRVADTVETLHDQGYSHNDIKPENICGGCLIDFGSMKRLDVQKADCYGSTPGYFKESTLGEPLTRQFDTYGIAVTAGVVLYRDMPPKDTELTREKAQKWGEQCNSEFAPFVAELFAHTTAKAMSKAFEKEITKLERDHALRHAQGLPVSGRTATI